MLSKELLLTPRPKKGPRRNYMPPHWGTADNFEHLEEPYKSIRKHISEHSPTSSKLPSLLMKQKGAIDLPSDLLKPFSNTKRLVGLLIWFGDVDVIIPEDLFEYTPLLEELHGFMALSKGGTCSKLPENLFKPLKNLKQISQSFHNQSLIEIPENLFKYNKNLETVSMCFRDNKKLEKVPVNLFKHNPKLKTLQGSFVNNLKVNTPIQLCTSNPDLNSIEYSPREISLYYSPEQ